MRLLYAEDEKSLARAVSTILIKNNYSVDVVYDGESALDYLATENYDGAILDVMMPKLNGFEVLKRMRARGDRTPVLLLTAKAETAVTEKMIAIVIKTPKKLLHNPYSCQRRFRKLMRHPAFIALAAGAAGVFGVPAFIIVIA